MIAKDIAKQIVDSLPDDSTLDDVIHALYLKAKFDRGEEEVRRGEGMTDEQVREKLRKWAG